MTLTAKENPFAAQRIESLPFQFAHGDWDYQLRRLAQLSWRGSIVGPRGSGKTTLLLELKQRLNDDQFGVGSPDPVCYCLVSRAEIDRLAQLTELENAIRQNQLVLVDGIERFSWRQRRHILHCKSSRMVVTSHRRIGLPVWLHNQTSPELAQRLLRQLVNNPDSRLIDECDRLFRQHRGNIRDVFRSLFDQSAFGREKGTLINWRIQGAPGRCTID